MVASCDSPQSAPRKSQLRPPTKFERKATSTRQLLILQALMLKTAQSDETEASDKSGCARAWCELEKLRMVKQGKPIHTSMSSTQVRIQKPRKFGMLRSVSAEIVDVETTPKAAENATPQAERVSTSETIPAAQPSKVVTPSE